MAYRAVVLACCLIFLPMLTIVQGTNANKQAVTEKEGGGKTLEGIRFALKSYITAFQAKDIDGVMAHFANAPNTVMMGTGPAEIWLGKEDIRMAHHAFFADFEKEVSERKLVSVGAEGNVAWLTGYILATQQHNNTSATFQVNLSMVFERNNDDDKWYITTMHFSNLTGPDNREAATN